MAKFQLLKCSLHNIESRLLPGRPGVHQLGEGLDEVQEHAAERRLQHYTMRFRMLNKTILLIYKKELKIDCKLKIINSRDPTALLLTYTNFLYEHV